MGRDPPQQRDVPTGTLGRGLLPPCSCGVCDPPGLDMRDHDVQIKWGFPCGQRWPPSVGWGGSVGQVLWGWLPSVGWGFCGAGAEGLAPVGMASVG